MIKEYIKSLEPYVLEMFKDDYTGHDIKHLERTMKTALYICNKEKKGDKLIVALAAYLHDIHRIIQAKEKRFVSPKETLPVARELLSHVDLTEEQIEKICYCIEYHEEYNWNGKNVKDINALIVQDADNIDALGAIGLARTFNYGGSYKKRMFDEDKSLDLPEDFVEEVADNYATINHLFYKELRLEKYMNTKTATKIAKKRTKFMRKFIKNFIEEWKANYY